MCPYSSPAVPQHRETGRPEILTQPPPEIRVQTGQEVRLVVVAHGHDHLSYQWYCEANPLPYGTSRELVLPQVTHEDSGTYTCSISSPTGGSVISNPARVLVSPPQPAFPQHPQPPFSEPHMPQAGPPVPLQQGYAQPQWVPAPEYGYDPGQVFSPVPPAMASPFMSGHSIPAEMSAQPPQQRQTRYGSPNSPGEDRPIGEGRLSVFIDHSLCVSMCICIHISAA